MLVMVVLGMRCASSLTKVPTQRTPTASAACCRLYSAGSAGRSVRGDVGAELKGVSV